MTLLRIRPALWWPPACLLALLGLSVAPAAAQDADAARKKAILEGTHVFRRILFDGGMKSLTGFDDETLQQHPEQCILIVLGDLNSFTAAEVRRLKDGAAVLLASDRAPEGEAAALLPRLTGTTIDGRKLRCMQADHCYQNRDYCPWLEPFDNTPSEELLKNLHVATNLPSWLGRPGRIPREIALASLPESCVVQAQQPQVLDNPLFAVGGTVGQGRLLLLADHSLFINEMMLPTDNNNVEFAQRCIAWLQKGGEQERTHVLFVEEGQVQPKFDIPLRNVEVPVEQALRMLYGRRNQLLLEAEGWLTRREDANFFNGVVLDGLDRIGLTPMRLTQWLVGLGTLALLVVGFYRLAIRHRFRNDASVPPLAGQVGRMLPDAPLAQQRTDELIAGGNLWEPAAVLVRHWFVRLGVQPGAEGEPAFTVQGGWWRRREQTARLRRLWQTAQGRRPERVSAPRLWRLQRELDELRVAFERGAWGIVPPGA